MNIKNKLSEVFNFFSTNRGIGHSELVKIIAKNNDAIVICPTQQEASFFVNGVSLSNLEKLKGVQKPCILDNHTVLILTKDALLEIEKIEKGILKRDSMIKKINEAITEYEQYIISNEPEKEAEIFNNKYLRRLGRFS